MKIFPAIDLRDGKVVRLYQGDYDKMTVYGDDPVAVAKGFAAAGAEYLHVVDLDGAKDGDTPNSRIVGRLAAESGLKVEIGGGIRSEAVIKAYLDAGVYRVILGTVAVSDRDFTAEMIRKYGDKIAVGVDISQGKVAVCGWKQISDLSVDDIFARLTEDGVSCIICTDISKDGAMEGTNIALYRRLAKTYPVQIVASGGVSSLKDVEALAEIDIGGAIIGKALYTGAVDLKEAVAIAEKNAEKRRTEQ